MSDDINHSHFVTTVWFLCSPFRGKRYFGYLWEEVYEKVQNILNFKEKKEGLDFLEKKEEK